MTPSAPSPPTSAFISYAREDAAFAHALDDALNGRGIRVLIDRSAIAPAEEFEKQHDVMILEADAVVFLKTTASLALRYCQWEVARAEELRKRIVPVVHDQARLCSLLPITTSRLASSGPRAGSSPAIVIT